MRFIIITIILTLLRNYINNQINLIIKINEIVPGYGTDGTSAGMFLGMPPGVVYGNSI
jgi:hypothetical protein